MSNENWIPKTGEEILVRSGLGDTWDKRIFLCKWDGRYLCAMKNDEESSSPKTVDWKYAKPIPKPQYRPYTMKEFAAAWEGKQLAATDTEYRFTAAIIEESAVSLKALIGGRVFHLSYLKVLQDFKWPDGTPCGVEVVE